jgi:hypothetical protein
MVMKMRQKMRDRILVFQRVRKWSSETVAACVCFYLDKKCGSNGVKPIFQTTTVFALQLEDFFIEDTHAIAP